ncbi:hypothetical protein [Luteibacter sp.]|uniref:hypothetical protein n=1 Tax=Luteibacter sp. TaxID=1886636 RepID=UPI0025C5E140|nr:hypothetical protein [Luteibacter sp.]
MQSYKSDEIGLFDVIDGGDGDAVVVGISDSEEYASFCKFPTVPKRDAGLLVVLDDGSLKWRPLLGMPLIVRKKILNPQGTQLAERYPPASSIPAYQGCYVSGAPIELMDTVRLDASTFGQVVAIIGKGLFSKNCSSKDWAYLKYGFLVESSHGGLEWMKDANNDLELLWRAQG